MGRERILKRPKLIEMTDSTVLDQEMVDGDRPESKEEDTAPEDDFVEADASAELTEDEEPVEEYTTDDEAPVEVGPLYFIFS